MKILKATLAVATAEIFFFLENDVAPCFIVRKCVITAKDTNFTFL